MQFYKIFAGSLLTTGIALSGCTTEQIEIPQSELYAREFIKQFGVVDPNHDWNNATQGSVTVVTSSPSHVEVLADIKGKRYIFADYQNVKGSETINFTIPKGVSDLIVNLDGRQFKTTVGGTVTATKSSRAIWEKEDNVVKISRTKDYRPLTPTGVLGLKEMLPEDKDNRGKVTQNFKFLANGDFIIYPVFWNTAGYNTLGIYYIDETTNEMVHVPFYTNKIIPIDGTKGNLLFTLSDPEAEDAIPANNNIPLLDNSNPLTIPNDNDRFNKVLNPIDYNNSGKTSFLEFNDDDWKIFKRRWLRDFRETVGDRFYIYDFSSYFDLRYITDKQSSLNSQDLENLFVADIICEAKDETHVNITRLALGPVNGWRYPGSWQSSCPDWLEKTATGWKSRGIHVHINPGTKFGMYIRNWITNDPIEDKPTIDNVGIVRLPIDPTTGMPKPDKYRRFYSENIYNPDLDNNGKGDVFAATYMYEAPSGTYRVLGFEDWGQNKSQLDLNDMVFFISSSDPYMIPDVDDIDHPDPEPEKYEYLIAAEDLGGTCDWDFNDVVASVTTVSKNYTDDTAEGGTATSYPYTEVTVTPLAAGGTLTVYLMYTGEVCTSKDDYNTPAKGNFLFVDEFHSWLTGVSAAPTVPTNVNASASTKGTPVVFHVPGNEYTLGCHEKYSSEGEKNNMGGFWIIAINSEDAGFTPALGNQISTGLYKLESLPEGKGINQIVAPQTDLNLGNLAPQMICVGNDWLWPREGKKIHDAYPKGKGPGFEGWLEDHKTVNGDWYGEGKYNESLVTKRN